MRPPLSFVDVSGVGNSGKSALVDLLREFDAFWVPHYSFEFDLLRVRGGLLDLRTWLCDDWSPIRSHAAVHAFRDVLDRMGVDPRWWDVRGLLRSTSQRYDRSFNGRFRALSREFVDSFVIGSYRAEWPYDALRESDWVRLARKLLRRAGLRGKLLRDVLLVDGQDFAVRATRYLQDLYHEIVPQGTDWAVLNNGFEPFNPLPALDTITGSRQMVVTRDPRDVFVSGLNLHRVAAGSDRTLLSVDNDGLNKSFLATDDLALFVKRYRLYHEKLYRGTDPRVAHLRFEDLVRDYEASVHRVMAFLGLQRAQHARPGQSFSPARSGSNVGLWRSYSGSADIEYIARELPEYLVN
jgi:hypothetical protein